MFTFVGLEKHFVDAVSLPFGVKIVASVVLQDCFIPDLSYVHSCSYFHTKDL